VKGTRPNRLLWMKEDEHSQGALEPEKGLALGGGQSGRDTVRRLVFSSLVFNAHLMLVAVIAMEERTLTKRTRKVLVDASHRPAPHSHPCRLGWWQPLKPQHLAFTPAPLKSRDLQRSAAHEREDGWTL
jgi:hypothetical protein